MENLKTPPIVEAVIDIECDMPISLKLSDLQSQSDEAFKNKYPKRRGIYLQEHQINFDPKHQPQHSLAQNILRGFQYRQEDEKQLIQIRIDGYSFNRLAPYSKLDDYLPEIKRTWDLFVSLASPSQVKAVRLRYINKVLLPVINGIVELKDFLEIGPRLPDEQNLEFVGFLNQHNAIDKNTGNLVNIILAAQPKENGFLPIIFDIATMGQTHLDPNSWDAINAKIQELRILKNQIFHSTLTKKCLLLFQN